MEAFLASAATENSLFIEPLKKSPVKKKKQPKNNQKTNPTQYLDKDTFLH